MPDIPDLDRDDHPFYYISRVAKAGLKEGQDMEVYPPGRKESYKIVGVPDIVPVQYTIHLSTAGVHLPDGTATGIADAKLNTWFISVDEEGKFITKKTQPRIGDDYAGVEKAPFQVSLIGPLEAPYRFTADGKPTTDKAFCFVTVDQFGNVGCVYDQSSVYTILRILFTRYGSLNLSLDDSMKDNKLDTKKLTEDPNFQMLANMIECREYRSYYVPPDEFIKKPEDAKVRYLTELQIALRGDRVVFRIFSTPDYLMVIPIVTEPAKVDKFYGTKEWKKFVTEGLSRFGFKEAWSFADPKAKKPKLEDLHYPFQDTVPFEFPFAPDVPVLFSGDSSEKYKSYALEQLESHPLKEIDRKIRKDIDEVLSLILDPRSTTAKLQKTISSIMEKYISKNQFNYAVRFSETLYRLSDELQIVPRIIDGPGLIRVLESTFPVSEPFRTVDFRELKKETSLLNPGAEQKL